MFVEDEDEGLQVGVDHLRVSSLAGAGVVYDGACASVLHLPPPRRLLPAPLDDEGERVAVLDDAPPGLARMLDTVPGPLRVQGWTRLPRDLARHGRWRQVLLHHATSRPASGQDLVRWELRYDPARQAVATLRLTDDGPA